MVDGIGGGKPGTLGPYVARNLPARVEGGSTANLAPARQARAAVAAGTVSRALVVDIAKAPPVNNVRVAQLKAEIEGGRYTLNPDAIAAAMLRLDRGLA